MENDNFLRRNLPTILWIAVLASTYFVLSALITPFASGITLNTEIVTDRLKEIGSFLFGILGGLTIIEIYFYQIFLSRLRTCQDKPLQSRNTRSIFDLG